MSINRWDAKRDANEAEIIEALEKAGCLVRQQDDYDLMICRGTTVYIREVKSKTGKLTKCQRSMIDEGWPLKVVHTVDEALKSVGIL